jgi:hypothetical protein
MKNFGQSISASNTNIVAICDGDNTYIHQLINDEWTITQTIRGMGSSCSITQEGEYLAILNNKTNLINIFKKNNNDTIFSSHAIIDEANINYEQKIKLIKKESQLKLITSTLTEIIEFKIETNQSQNYEISDTVSISKFTEIGPVKLNNILINWDVSDNGEVLVFTRHWKQVDFLEYKTNVSTYLASEYWSTLEQRNFTEGIFQLFQKNNQDVFVEDLGFIKEGLLCCVSGDGESVGVGEATSQSNISIKIYNKEDRSLKARPINLITIESINEEKVADSYMLLDRKAEKFSINAGTSGQNLFLYNKETNQWDGKMGSSGELLSSRNNAEIEYGGGANVRLFFNERFIISSVGGAFKVEQVTELNRILLKSNSLNFGDLDWYKNESYSIRPSNLDSILSSEKRTTTCLHNQDEFAGDSNSIFESIIMNDENLKPSYWSNYAISKDTESPYGSIFGDYEFINIKNIKEKWQNELIYKSTLNNRYQYECTSRDSGRCRPIWADKYRPQSSEDPVDIEFVYGKNLILERNIDHQLNNSTNSFKSNVASIFWKKFELFCSNYSALCTLNDESSSNKSLALCNVIKTGSQSFVVIENFRFSPSLVNFIDNVASYNFAQKNINVGIPDNQTYESIKRKEFKSEKVQNNLKTIINELEFNENNLLNRSLVDSSGLNFINELSKNSNCGASIPYMGFNEDYHVIERELICAPFERIPLSNENLNKEYANLSYVNIFVKWSISYVNPFGEKIEPEVFFLYYNIDETFTYRGVAYGVYDNFPFMDFNMNPIPWNNV